MSRSFRVLDLFGGIGGFSLGLELAGRFETVAFCESEPHARRVLRKHWPTVPLFEDVRTLTKRRLIKEGIHPDVICGGFPCQDISTAGKGAGIEGERSGLWKEMFRLVEEIRPRWVVAENVPALRSRGADVVLTDLEGAGYAAWPLVVGAVHAGAPHRRQRVWIVAHAQDRRPQRRAGLTAADSGEIGCWKINAAGSNGDGNRQDVADANGRRCEAWRQEESGAGTPLPHCWTIEPALDRVVDGIPHRVDRLRCLGNAVVPQVVELIGRAILDADPLATSTD